MRRARLAAVASVCMGAALGAAGCEDSEPAPTAPEAATPTAPAHSAPQPVPTATVPPDTDGSADEPPLSQDLEP